MAVGPAAFFLSLFVRLACVAMANNAASEVRSARSISVTATGSIGRRGEGQEAVPASQAMIRKVPRRYDLQKQLDFASAKFESDASI